MSGEVIDGVEHRRDRLIVGGVSAMLNSCRAVAMKLKKVGVERGGAKASVA